MTLRIERVEDWLGRPLVGEEGQKIGKLEDVIFTADGVPLLAAVSTGLFGRRTSLVPLAEASLTPDHVSVPYSKDLVKDAPQLGEADGMTAELEDAAAEHYALAPRTHSGGERYSTATERARQAERARELQEQADALEERADELAGEAEAAEQEARAARDRADALAREHQAAVSEAQRARQAQQDTLAPR